MTADEPPVVTTMRPGAILTGHVFFADGTKYSIEPGTGFASIYYQDASDACISTYVCQFESGTAAIAYDEYRLVGLPAGDYRMIFGSDDPVVVHVEAGSTTVCDITDSHYPPP
jgi:hypothetical protein